MRNLNKDELIKVYGGGGYGKNECRENNGHSHKHSKHSHHSKHHSHKSRGNSHKSCSY